MCNDSTRSLGTPRIIDKSGRRQLPVGIESFEDVIRNFVYVDKTLALEELIGRRGVSLYCRPRRFGKSTFLRMLQCFFELPVQGWVPDRHGLFEGLAISESDDCLYAEQHCAHPVIYLNLADCGAPTYQETMELIARMIGREYVRHAYLLSSPSLLGFERDRFERVASGTAQGAELSRSLTDLSDYLSRHHHNAQTVVLIDEYDTPVNDAHLHGFRTEVLSFYRSWLSSALKGTTNLYCAALTGVLRVSQESIFSELNNVQINTTLDNDHAESIGFTEDEVHELAGYVGKSSHTKVMATWYDGYTFGRTRVYNPWSVLNYLRKGIAQPYWTNTSRNGIVVDLIRRATEEQTVDLATLASGGRVHKPLDLRTVFDDLSYNPEAVWAQLYQTGYVTTEDTGTSNDVRRRRALHIPNLEVKELYASELLARATHLAGSPTRLSVLHRSIVHADAVATQAALRQILLDTPSFHDLVDEGDYHVLMLALLYGVEGYRPATSNRESGDGRCDILLEPVSSKAGELAAHAMELKLLRGASVNDASLASCAREVALAQAGRLSYGHGLAGTGLVRWGIAFCGKRIACACEWV